MCSSQFDHAMNGNSFFFCQLPVFGQLGPRTAMDRTVHPPRVHQLHCLIDVSLSSQIFEVFPCVIADERLCRSLHAAGCSGFMERKADFGPSDILHEVHPKITLPKLSWLQITGIPASKISGLKKRLSSSFQRRPEH